MRDVSADPTGEQGPKIASFNNNLEFKDSEISYGVGGIYNWFAKSEKEKKRSDFIKYFLVPFRIGYIYNEASLPIIPYFFYKQAGQVMFEEGKIQKAVVKNSMVGFGWDWKYADLFYYLGSSRIQLTDQDDVKRNLKTNGNITKFRLRYEWEIEDKYVDYTIGPYFQMTYYDFNDDQVGKSTSVGGDFFIYKLGLNLGFKI